MAIDRVLCELEELLAYLVTYCETLADLVGVKVLTEETGDLTNTIARNLAKLGLSCVLYMPSAMPKKAMTARVNLEAHVVLTIAENVLINRSKTGKSALFIASRVLAELNNLPLPFAWCRELLTREPGMQKLNIITDPTKPANEQPTVVGYGLHFTALVAVTPRQTT
jgi:hypothetical protein